MNFKEIIRIYFSLKNLIRFLCMDLNTSSLSVVKIFVFTIMS